MHLVRWGAVLATIVLAVVMKAPVWYVIARISEIVGGTGWHRAYLIDQAISHFDEWWLVGTTSTAHWAPAGEVLLIDPMNMDITNQYVMEAVGGGVVKLGLFLAMIVKSFSIIGQAIRRLNGRDECCEKLIWAFGVSLWSHCVSFISIAYFDQLISLWYLSLAVIALFSLPTLRPDGLIGGQSRMRKESLSSGQINESSSARLSDWGKWAESKRRRKAADV
jgi:hypothetical protein